MYRFSMLIAALVGFIGGVLTILGYLESGSGIWVDAVFLIGSGAALILLGLVALAMFIWPQGVTDFFYGKNRRVF